jgi:hypothetical protein
MLGVEEILVFLQAKRTPQDNFVLLHLAVKLSLKGTTSAYGNTKVRVVEDNLHVC